MGITIKYKGLEDGPLLVTASGVYPPVSSASGEPRDLAAPGGLYLSANPSELRQSLRKMEQEAVLDEVYRKAEDLSRLIGNLHLPESDLLLRAKTAVSSQPEALSASADELATTPARHTLEIRHPAQPRTILSAPQNPVEEVSLADGEHSLTLTIEGQEHTVTFEVNNSDDGVDTQEEFLATVARALDGVDSRISARVVYGEQDAYDPAPRSRPMNRTVRLEITSTEEGQGPDFYLSDPDGETIARDYRLDAAPPSRPARLVLEGALRDQSTNTLDTDSGHLTGTIKDSTVSPLNIDVSQGPQVITQELSQVIAKYNELVRYLDAHADLLRPSLKDRVVRPLEDRAGLVGQVGLRATAQGRLEMQENFAERVNAAFDKVRSVLAGEGGWAEALDQKLKQILEVDPEAFAADLSHPSPSQARSRAFDLAESLSISIINGYY